MSAIGVVEVEKEQQKAEGEALLQKAQEAHKGESEELYALQEYVSNLHGQCAAKQALSHSLPAEPGRSSEEKGVG